ncbi:unnamed protein product, partial [Discosporangium mesarthrocarpum]
KVVYTPDGARLLSSGADGLLCLYHVSRGYQPVRMIACDPPPRGMDMLLSVSPLSDQVAVLGSEPSCILLYDVASLVMRRRLGRSSDRRVGSSVAAGGGVFHPHWYG